MLHRLTICRRMRVCGRRGRSADGGDLGPGCGRRVGTQPLEYAESWGWRSQAMSGLPPGNLLKPRGELPFIFGQPETLAVTGASSAALWDPKSWHSGPYVLKQEKWA